MSLERCPGCRFRLADAFACPRCGCDLWLVRRAESEASRRVARAVHAWARGDHEAAVASASAALMFERSELAQAVLQSIRQASSWPSGSFAASAPQSPILTGLDGDPVQTSAS